MGADGEGWDVEESGLESVSRGDNADVVGRGLKREDRGKDGAGREEVLVGGVF